MPPGLANARTQPVKSRSLNVAHAVIDE
jgi:hypothetical protein